MITHYVELTAVAQIAVVAEDEDDAREKAAAFADELNDHFETQYAQTAGTEDENTPTWTITVHRDDIIDVEADA